MGTKSSTGITLFQEIIISSIIPNRIGFAQQQRRQKRVVDNKWTANGIVISIPVPTHSVHTCGIGPQSHWTPTDFRYQSENQVINWAKRSRQSHSHFKWDQAGGHNPPPHPLIWATRTGKSRINSQKDFLLRFIAMDSGWWWVVGWVDLVPCRSQWLVVHSVIYPQTIRLTRISSIGYGMGKGNHIRKTRSDKRILVEEKFFICNNTLVLSAGMMRVIQSLLWDSEWASYAT